MNETSIGLFIAIIPLIISALAFVMNSLIDKKVNQALKVQKAQITQLQMAVSLLQAKANEEVDTFIRDVG